MASSPRRVRATREYGRAGLYGLLTPQANPTAEPELRVLLPPASALLAARLTSACATLRERLADYRERLGEFIGEFAGLELDAIAFACTGSSYGRDPADERRRLAAIAERAGCPIVTAAGAVEAALAHLGVGAIAVISPYPLWLSQACGEHWRHAGLRVTATLQLRPVATGAHPVYARVTSELLGEAAAFDLCGADAVLIAGTGMPSLRAIAALEREHGVPVLSPNLCLAWSLARVTSAAAAGPESRLYGGWAERLEVA